MFLSDGSDCTWRHLFHCLGCSCACQGCGCPRQGQGLGGAFHPASGCLSPTLLPLPDSFQARFPCTADSPGYDKQSELQCRASTRLQGSSCSTQGWGGQGTTPHLSKPAWGKQGTKSSRGQTGCAVTVALEPPLHPQLEMSLVLPSYPDPNTDTIFTSLALCLPVGSGLGRL